MEKIKNGGFGTFYRIDLLFIAKYIKINVLNPETKEVKRNILLNAIKIDEIINNGNNIKN